MKDELQKISNLRKKSILNEKPSKISRNVATSRKATHLYI